MLTRITQGARGAAPPLLIVPGLFGSARNWGAIARRLANDREVVALDMRNHGDSPWTDSHGYEDLGRDLAKTVDAVSGPANGTADVLGHSMGGKAAMQLALTEPARIRRLIVADIAPVAYGHSQMELIEAMRGLDLDGLTLRSEADRRLAERVKSPSIRAFLLQSLDLRAEPPRWRLNLDTLGREMDRIIGWPGTPGRFEGPALFLTGSESDYVRPEHREAILGQFPAAEFRAVEGAGHWLHAEKPREVEKAVEAFLR